MANLSCHSKRFSEKWNDKTEQQYEKMKDARKQQYEKWKDKEKRQKKQLVNNTLYNAKPK